MAMPKRKADEEYDSLLKKKIELEEQLKQLKGDDPSDSEMSMSTEDSDDDFEAVPEKQTDTQVVHDDLKKEDLSIDKENEALSEKPLSDSLRLAIGEDPSISKAKRVDIHSNLINHWNYYSLNGINKEDREQLLEKYEVPSKLKAPLLNEQLIGKLNDKAVRRDKYRYETQRAVSMALTALGSAITMINNDEEGIDQEAFLEKLADTAKLMADVQHQLIDARKAFIVPRFSKAFQDVLKKSKSDSLLFGSDLPTKIKEIKDADRLLKDVTPDRKPPVNKNSGNFKRPLGTKNSHNRMGNTSTEGQGKPRLYFKKYQRDHRQNNQYQQQSQNQKRNQRNTN